tara:strand:- start:5758 stop:6912 length:1155 start_codon:yes stop_codon:yes gene_type:complete
MAQLDYRLTGNTLDRVQRAGATVRPEFSGSDAVESIGEDISKDIKGKQDSLALWDTGFESQGDRGSWASTNLFDSFQGLETAYRDEYISAVKSGDKQLQQKLLKQQGDRSSSLQSWKGTMDTAKSTNDDIGWGAMINNNPENKQILGALAAQDGTARMRMTDKMEMVFDVDILDENGNVTHTKTVKRSDVDKLVSRGMIPYERENDWFDGLLAIEESGLSNKSFHDDIQLKRNMSQIKPENVESMMYDKWTGTTTFAEDFLEHPELNSGYVQLADLDGDGTLSEYELGQNAPEQMLKAMAGDADVARDILAEWMTMKQKKMWTVGNKKYKRDKWIKDQEDKEGDDDSDGDSDGDFTDEPFDAESEVERLLGQFGGGWPDLYPED